MRLDQWEEANFFSEQLWHEKFPLNGIDVRS